jgi:uncharacterized protein YcbK (DUF882 family)
MRLVSLDRNRRLFPSVLLALAVLSGGMVFLPLKIAEATPPAKPVYRLRLYETHTTEHIDVVYREGNVYIPAAVSRLDHFLRDHRTGDVYDLDPRLFDLLHDLEAAVGHPNSEIDIICGYRTPWSNEFLRRSSGGVAKHSRHMEGQAIDIRIPGVSTARLRDAALALHRGGVGYYPISQFVHVDVGPVRRWRYPLNAGSALPGHSAL